MSEPFDLRETFAASLAAAKLMQTDSADTRLALEAIESRTADERDFLKVWDAIEEEIGKAEDVGLQRQLSELRARFLEQAFTAIAGEIEQAFKRSPDAGRKAWLTALAEAITKFRFGFSARLCEHSFPFPESETRALESLKKAVRCMRQSRWPETYEQFDYLANLDFLSVVTRARLFVMMGQIQLFHFAKAGSAREFFERAELLMPDEPGVVSASGDYWLQEKDGAKATSAFRRAIEIAPGAPYGYAGMGKYFENQQQLEAAEEWYKKTIEAARGDNLGYGRLFQLYGRPELFKQRASDLSVLLDRMIAINPEDAYGAYCDLGDIYQQNSQLDEAQQYFETAITLDEARPRGYVALAQSYEKQNRNGDAEDAYKKAIEVAPECYDGYFGLTWLYEQREKWEDALDWYKRAPLYPKEWASISRAKIGEMHSKLQNYNEAEKILKEELRANHDNVTAKTALETLADNYSKKRDTRAAAIRIYDEVLAILEDTYKGDYHNRLGNLRYFHAENEQAAEEYRRAIAADPNEAVFHRNLALAYKGLKNYSQAVEELNHAFRIDSDTQKLNREMALLRNAEANDYYARGDYRKAVQQFSLAIQSDATDAVIHANLASAWELLREPGGGSETLDKAIEALKCAQRINPSGNYGREIERISRKKAFAAQYGPKALDRLHVVTPIAIEVAQDLIPYTEGDIPGTLSEELLRQLTALRGRLWNNFGVKTPGVLFRGNDTGLSNGTYVIIMMEIPLVSGSIELDQRFCPGPAEILSSLDVTGTAATNPLTGTGGFWIKKGDWEKVETAGIELWEVADYLIRHLESFLQRNLIEFLGHDDLAGLLGAESPTILEQVRGQPQKFTALATIARSLLAERVPITGFNNLYKEFDGLYAQGTPLRIIVESLRSLPQLRSLLPGNDSQSSILPLGPRFEAEIRDAIYERGTHAVLAMEPERCQTALSTVRSGLTDHRPAALMVDDAELRPFVRMLTELEFPDVPILARRELGGDLQVQSLPLIELPEDVPSAKPDFRSRGQIDSSQWKVSAPGSSDIAITVFVNDAFRARSKADVEPIEVLFSMMQDGLFHELGIVLPDVRIEIDTNLKTNEFRLRFNGIEYPTIEALDSDEFLVNDTVERLTLLQITGREAVNPANCSPCAVIRGEKTSLETCRQAGLTTWGPAGYLVLHLSAAIRKKASAFQNIMATEYMLDSLRVTFPHLIDTAMKRFSVERLCLVLRDLLDEEISVRDMRAVLESMLSINGTTDVDQNRYIVFTPRTDNLCPVTSNEGLDNLNVSDHSNFVRTSLKRYISHKYTRGSNTLVVYLVDRAIEERLSNIGAQPLTNEERTNLIAAVRDELGNLPSTAQNPVLLTSMHIRKALKKLLEGDFSNLAVLSYQELSPDLNIQPIARISWD